MTRIEEALRREFQRRAAEVTYAPPGTTMLHRSRRRTVFALTIGALTTLCIAAGALALIPIAQRMGRNGSAHTPIPGASVGPSGSLAYLAIPPGSNAVEIVLGPVSGRTDEQTRLDSDVSASRVSWNPDGTALVFAKGTGEGRGQVDVLDLSTLDSTTIFEGTDGAPQAATWSTDGDAIAFTTDEGGLKIIRPDGSGLQQVTESNTFDPAWSPDSSEIAFRTMRGDIGTMAADGSNPRIVAEGKYIQPAWSPDGATIAAATVAGDIVLIPASGGQTSVLVRGGDNFNPSWSPSGDFIAFSSNRNGGNDIYVVAVTSGDVTVITDGAGDEYAPAWRPAVP